MRCSKCGWSDNPDGAQNCVKCNAPLTITSSVSVNQKQDEKDLSKTIKGGESPLPSWDKEKLSLNCSKCGYLMRQGTMFCPNCGTAASSGKQDITETINDGATVRKISSENEVNISGTIDPYKKAASKNCFLKLVERTNENNKVVINIEGSPVSLNRDNLEPENKSITGKDQAFLEFKDGTWYLTDKSELGTTFIRVKYPYALKEGDIILFGDRKFEFHIQND
ncbi:MAG: zinc ribbon domain-containing protein [Bacteroidota bacterium]